MLTEDFVWPLRIYYEDTDAGGVVYYANYLKFLERARTEWLRHLGIEQTQIKQQNNLIFVVRQVSIDYLRPARFNDFVHVITQITRLGQVSITMTQQILRQQEVLCSAVVKLACVDASSFRPQPLPKLILSEWSTP